MPRVTRASLGLLRRSSGFTIPPMAEDEDEYGDYKPSIREAFRNWRHWNGPFSEKVRLTVRNEWIKVRTFKDCCGHIDEPGC